MVLFSGQNIITPKAEKGGAVVIVDVDDYENKANFTMLSTKNTNRSYWNISPKSQ